MSTAIVAALVLTQRNGIKFQDLVEKFSWLKELIIQKGNIISCLLLSMTNCTDVKCRFQGGWNDPILHPVNYVVKRAIKLLHPLIIERNRRLEPNYVTITDQRTWVTTD